MKTYTWDERIARAEKLIQQQPATRQVLDVYVKATRFQKKVGETFQGNETSISVQC